MLGDRKYVIVNVSDVTDEMINSSFSDSINSTRKNSDGTKAILKWDGDTPACFDGLTIYSHDEIFNIVHSDNGWKTKGD